MGYLDVGHQMKVFKKRLNEYSPLLDKMIQSRHWLSIFQVLRQPPFLSSDGPSKLFGKCLVLSELDKQRLVEKILDVLVIVE